MRSTRYSKFTRARDLLLEDIHKKTQIEISRLVDAKVQQLQQMLRYKYEQLKAAGLFGPIGKNVIAQTKNEMDHILMHLSFEVLPQIKKLRRDAYALAHIGEAEAIAQAINKRTRYSLTRDKLHTVENSQAYSGGSLEDRVQHAINSLSAKVIKQLELCVLKKMPGDQMMAHVNRVLPKPKSIRKKVVKAAAKLKESSKPDDPPDLSQGYIDDQTWEEIVDAYKQEYVPSWRGPKSVASTEGEETVYAWELEKEITQDFVYQVRSGQVDAAKENGINDYVWVAIVDKVTDDCCLWRDGLTTQEIEEKLKTSRADDECQTIVPPAHFNCRCVLAPMVEEMPERPESNEKDFERWLNT
jgi:hypothetical protein